ncbi:hypothetical protein ACN38_g11155 [Penicillium nordicum]|uniref:Uncharacterized protein n=1 Tax=Penicillium nordicum TaxID=229535 RepID=A0A0M9WB06_9EURO|nr:hypothetical protein ACN38_g11155 [Penicillium nordicum]
MNVQAPKLQQRIERPRAVIDHIRLQSVSCQCQGIVTDSKIKFNCRRCLTLNLACQFSSNSIQIHFKFNSDSLQIHFRFNLL